MFLLRNSKKDQRELDLPAYDGSSKFMIMVSAMIDVCMVFIIAA